MGYNKKLSIIIPVYNTEKYLKKCLDSVVAAIDERMEVLIINDGSPDNSEDIILKYVEQYPTLFSYYKKQNGGLSDVKNYGLERAKGDFVIFLDSDDFVESNMYRDMLRTAKNKHADVVICDIYMDYEENIPQRIVSCQNNRRGTTYYKVLDTWMMPASWNKMVKRTLYEGLDFPKGLNNEDVCVTPVVLARADNIVIMSKPYYHYLQRSGSIQNSTFNEKRFVILDTVKLALERMKSENIEKQKQLKNTLYLHQVISMAMYPIREVDNFQERKRLLTLFMNRTYDLFPDIMEVESLQELVHWGNILMRIYRKISLKLLEKRKYSATCCFWSICNIGFRLFQSKKRY